MCVDPTTVPQLLLTTRPSGATTASRVRRRFRESHCLFSQADSDRKLIFRVAVVARFRPQNKIELASGGQPIVSFQSEDTCSIQVRVKVACLWVQRFLTRCLRTVQRGGG